MSHEPLKREWETQGPSDRSFGLVFTAVFAVLALLPLFHGGTVRLWSLGIGAVFGVLAFAAPNALAPLNRLWFKLGLLLHRVVNPIVLGIMFYLVITPMGLVMRLLGKDPLHLKRDPAAPSYWIDRVPPGPKPESLGEQF